MPSYDIRKLQLRILNNLLALHKVCEEHHLKYYIVAGTLLGAIRHKGFIPWDDDLDVGMPRDDYERLIAHAHEWLPQPFEFVSYETDRLYPLPFAKLQDASTTLIERMHLKYLGGIYIDIFPLDGMTDNVWQQRIHFVRYEFYKQVLYLVCRDPYKHGRGVSSWIPLFCRKVFKLDEVQRTMRKLQRQYDFYDSPCIADHDFGVRGVLRKEIYGAGKKVDFEGHEVIGPDMTDEYLSIIYGSDYMVPPPAHKIKQHLFHYLDLNKPYRVFGDSQQEVINA